MNRLAIVPALLALMAQPAFPAEAPPAAAEPAQEVSGANEPKPVAANPAAAPVGASGMRVYVDPQTGKFLAEPPAGVPPLQLSPWLLNALSTSHAGLVMVPSAVPGGGFKIDLKGRFQSPLFATIDASGKVRMQHLDAAPRPDDRK